MSLPKKGKPIPADLARDMLREVSAMLEREAESGRHSPSMFHAGLAGSGLRAPALRLAAGILEAVADGESHFGALIDGRGLAMPYREAVREVYSQAVRADLQGEPITREEAFERANEAMGRNDCKRLYLEWEKRFGRWEFPTTKKKRRARVKG